MAWIRKYGILSIICYVRRWNVKNTQDIVWVLLRSFPGNDFPSYREGCWKMERKRYEFSNAFSRFVPAEWFVKLFATIGCTMGTTGKEVIEFNVQRTGSYTTGTITNVCRTRRITSKMGWAEQSSNWFVFEKKADLLTKVANELILFIFSLDLSNYRPVYAPKDLLEVLLTLKGPTQQDDELNITNFQQQHLQILKSWFFFAVFTRNGNFPILRWKWRIYKRYKAIFGAYFGQYPRIGHGVVNKFWHKNIRRCVNMHCEVGKHRNRCVVRCGHMFWAVIIVQLWVYFISIQQVALAICFNFNDFSEYAILGEIKEFRFDYRLDRR